MKKNAFATVLMVFALAFFSGCAAPDYERSAESKMNMDRIPSLQRDLDDGRISGSLPVREEQEFQARLHSIRRDYSMMTEGGKPISCQERVNVSLRLDSLTREMEKYR